MLLLLYIAKVLESSRQESTWREQDKDLEDSTEKLTHMHVLNY